MQLNPRLPPGRVTRKARQYEHEVQRLRAEGYTLNAIREALFDAGITVGIATVRREANRALDQRGRTETQAMPSALNEARQDAASVPMTVSSPSPLHANTSLPEGLADGDAAIASSRLLDGCLSASSYDKVFEAFFLGRPVG